MNDLNTKIKKLDFIQVARGLAAIIVVLYHTGTLFAKNLNFLVFKNAFKFGHSGVIFFFVLSGFIIYYIHYKDIGNKSRFNLFLKKRFLRIYPVYWIIVLIKLPTKTIKYTLLIETLFLFPTPEPYISVSWTLSFEIFFYICFGLLILKYSKIIFYIFFAYAFAIIYYNYFNNKGNIFFVNFLLNIHILEFSLGCLSAYVFIKYKSFKYGIQLLIFGVILFFLSAFFTVLELNSTNYTILPPYNQAEIINSIFEQHAILFYALPSAIIILGCAFIDYNYSIKVPFFLIFLGNASYSIYLTHAIFLNAFTLFIAHSRYNFDLNYLVVPVAIFSVFVGSLFHLIVEKPLLKAVNNLLN